MGNGRRNEILAETIMMVMRRLEWLGTRKEHRKQKTSAHFLKWKTQVEIVIST